MRRIRRGYFSAMALMVGAVLAIGAGAAQAGVSAANSGGTWHKAIEVPGTGVSVSATISSLSCVSPGNCAAGGYFHYRNDQDQPLVVTESAGKWGRATRVPGMNALNTGGFGFVTSVSCAPSGGCTANGYFESRTSGGMFVVSEVAGKWGPAIAMWGDSPDFLSTDSISCPSRGNCASGGNFSTKAGGASFHAFVVDETNGRWGKRLQLSGAILAAAFYSEVNNVTCSSAGNCIASGEAELNSNSPGGLFAATEQAGRWGPAVAIPDASTIGSGPDVESMACASAGNCAAAGSYGYQTGDTANAQPLVVSETAGQWNPAQNVPGLTRPRNGGVAEAYAVACAAPDSCVAGGSTPGDPAFVVSETGGTWGHVVMITGAKLGAHLLLQVTAVSCTSPGNCVAGGSWDNAHGHAGAFVVTQTGGHWGQAQNIPGLAALATGHYSQVNSISCPAADHCTAVGQYSLPGIYHERDFVVSES